MFNRSVSELASVPEDLQHVPFDMLIKTDGAPVPVDIDPNRDVLKALFRHLLFRHPEGRGDGGEF